MKNLAGNRQCDATIRQELQEADIQIVQHPQPLRQEVPASLTGILTLNGQDAFKFTRAWYYWVVSGDVPLDVAREMYVDEIGRQDVRVAGYAGNDEPENWAFPKGDVIAEYLQEKGLESVNYGELAKLCNSGEITGTRFVGTYHIDSQEGLNLFVATMRKHGLAS